jgi:hypothetical protein
MYWLATFLAIYFAISVQRLVRIPLLAYSKSAMIYFGYVAVTYLTIILALSGVFVWGNYLFWTSIRHDSCQATELYDPKLLIIIMGLIIMVMWIIFAGIV